MEWKKRYMDTVRKFQECDCDKTIVSGFNANIDRVLRAENVVEEGFEPEEMEHISSWEDFQKVLNYAVSNGVNMEIDLEEYRPDIEGGKKFIGGQGGIVSTFASRIGFDSVLYTPIISERLVEALDNGIKGPDAGEEVALKSIKKCVNSEKFKENLIFEFRRKKSGRMILSDHLEGFQPLFSDVWEDRIERLDELVDRFFLAGFHHLETGNTKKAGRQLERLSSPVHVEYVYTDDEKSDYVVEKILPNADSIGFDEEEMMQVLESIEFDGNPETVQEHVKALSEVKKFADVDRIHLHTYDFHICLVSKGYETSPETTLESMLFGEIAAVTSAENGHIPDTEEIENFNFKDKHFRGLSEIENYSETGIKEFKDFFACIIPVIIHEKPERLVGLGDLISAGSFFWELFQSQ